MTYSGILMLATLVAYFVLLLAISAGVRRKSDNNSFFRAGKQSKWYVVAFGMIGASISGVSFVSVPGWVATTGMTYLQMCMGFIVGYFVVAFVLLPLYYKFNLASIYDYLGSRYGSRSHHAGAAFFMLSKLTGASARLYMVCLVLQQFLAGPLGIPFPLTAFATLLLIWAYTHRSGIHVVVRTDAVLTACLIIALTGVVCITASRLGLDFSQAVRFVSDSSYSQVFEWDSGSKQAFWRQFLSGMFIVVVMTGLDQDMMQKNLTCKTLHDAQKDMCTYGLFFLPVNLLFLSLGILLYAFCTKEGITPPANSDDLLPMLVSSGHLGTWIVVPFTIGIVAAAFSSADSAMTALTTSFCIDFLGMEKKAWNKHKAERVRRLVHIAVAVLFLLCVLLFHSANSTNLINAIYVMASYTYGPLLGMFAFGMFTRRHPADRLVPLVAIASPLVCALLDHYSPTLLGYTFGYELLMLNGALTAAGLWLISAKGKTNALAK